MNNKILSILFLSFLIACISNAQELKEPQLIAEEKIETKRSTEIQEKNHQIFDHQGNAIADITFSYSGKKYFFEFEINNTAFKLEQYNFAKVNLKANRLYVFGKSSFPADCGGLSCNVNGFQIYDLSGNLIKNDSTFSTMVSGSRFKILDSGSFLTFSKKSNNDILLITKYDQNGQQLWSTQAESSNSPYCQLFTEVTKNNKLLLIEYTGNSKITLLDSEGVILLQTPGWLRSRFLLFNEQDLVFYWPFLGFFHYSVENKEKYPLYNKNFYFDHLNRVFSHNKLGTLFGEMVETTSKTEIAYLIFKKQSGRFLPYAKIDLAIYGFTRDERGIIHPRLSVSINENEEIVILSKDRKLRFKL